MAIAIAGERSGAGKTTITLALLAALKQRQLSVQSFKVGPDYIDPMFHTTVTGRPCRNLDPVLTSEAYVQACFAQHTQFVTCAVIEGVMGLFDGAGGTIAEQLDFASTAHIARLLAVPVLLVIDCARLSRSVAAIAQGYRSLDPRLQVAGVILNRVASDRHLILLQEALASIQMPILGVFRREANITIPDRHLGLVPTEELSGWSTLEDRLAHLGESGFVWDALLPLLQSQSHAFSAQPFNPESQSLVDAKPCRIAVARDRAFNFYYADNFDVLERLGAELIFFSPLRDPHLPETIQGLYLGGGFPEVFATELADNRPLCTSIQRSIRSGLPTYAECGGLMYLCQRITNFEQKNVPMLGLLPTDVVMGQRLTLGYRRAEALAASPFLSAGSAIAGHEFHRSHLTQAPTQPLFQLQSLTHPSTPTPEGWGYQPPSSNLNLHASYLHLHWGVDQRLVQGWLNTCQAYAKRQA